MERKFQVNGITADQMLEKSEAGKRGAELKLLLDGVLLECMDATRFGLKLATARLSDNNLPMREELTSILRGKKYTVLAEAKKFFTCIWRNLRSNRPINNPASAGFLLLSSSA